MREMLVKPWRTGRAASDGLAINAKVTAVQSFPNSIHLYCGSHVGGQKNTHQPIFPYNITENFPASFVRSSVFLSPNDFKFGTETRFMVLLAISKLGTNRS